MTRWTAGALAVSAALGCGVGLLVESGAAPAMLAGAVRGGGDAPRPTMTAASPEPANSITSDRTIRVASAAALTAAIQSIDRSVITGNASVVIHLDDGTYGSAVAGSRDLLKQIFITDPKFARVSFVGNCADPRRVTLLFDATNNLSGFLATNGGRIGLIDCMTINGVGAHLGGAKWNGESFGAGVVASGSGSAVRTGPGLTINDFYYGVASYYRADVEGSGTSVNNSGDANYIAGWGGSLRCLKCRADTAGHTAPNQFGAMVTLGANYISEMSGAVYIDGSTGTGARIGCVVAQTTGGMWAHQVDCQGSRGAGAKIAQNGFIELDHAHLHANMVGVEAHSGGGADLTGATIDGNASDGIVADGGRLYGSSVTIARNGGVGVKALHQGGVELYRSFAQINGNRMGRFYAEPAGVMNGAPFAASSLMLN